MFPKETKPADVPLSIFFMDRKDNDKVRGEFKTIIGWTVAELRTDFGWMKKYLPSRIGHEYMNETATKSEQVSSALPRFMYFLEFF